MINITSNSAVIVWDPIPPHLANGDMRYVVSISAASAPHHHIETLTRETVYRVTGIEADTVHLVTVTGHTGKGAGPVSTVVDFRTDSKYAHTHLCTYCTYTHKLVLVLYTHTVALYALTCSGIPMSCHIIGLRRSDVTISPKVHELIGEPEL